MLTRLTLGAAIIAGAAVLMPVSAAPLTPQSGLADAVAADGSLVTEVRRRGHRYRSHGRHFRGGHHRRHFRGGHHRRSWRHHRRHHRHWYAPHFFYFYGGGHSCSYWRSRCAAGYGWSTRRYYQCVWRHGC